MVSKTSKSTLWTLSILLTTANLIFAAPSINNEESSGSRAFIHSAPGGLPPSEFDLMPMVEQDNAVQASLPYQYVPIPATPVRQPSFENAILNYLSAKHLMMSLLNSKARRFNDWDSNEVNRKRSYKLCAFNAVSCFG